jgi:hypothetical protein
VAKSEAKQRWENVIPVRQIQYLASIVGPFLYQTMVYKLKGLIKFKIS